MKNGVLYGDNKPLLTGAEFYTTVTKQDPYDPKYTYEEWTYHADDAIGYVFKQMGFAGLLKDSELEYANKMTRLGLIAPDPYYGEKSYTYRWLDANK